MGDVFGGRYELVDALGRQGLWRVWDDRDRTYRVGQLVEGAPGVLTGLLARIPRTGAHLAVPVTGCAGRGATLVLGPLVAGQPLSDRLADREPIDIDNALEMTDQLLAALNALHGAGLVHRNICDRAVVLRAGRRPNVVLGWLGEVAEASGGGDARTLGGAVGTPGYMSFEAFSGAAPEPVQDLYSVGALLIQMLTGRRPSAGAVARGGAEVPAQYRGAPVGDFLGHLLATAAARTPSASAARVELVAVRAALNEAAGTGSRVRFPEPFVVADATPALPPAWSADGPLPARVSEHVVRVVREPGPDAERTPVEADNGQLAGRGGVVARRVLIGALLCVLAAAAVLLGTRLR